MTDRFDRTRRAVGRRRVSRRIRKQSATLGRCHGDAGAVTEASLKTERTAREEGRRAWYVR